MSSQSVPEETVEEVHATAVGTADHGLREGDASIMLFVGDVQFHDGTMNTSVVYVDILGIISGAMLIEVTSGRSYRA